ILALLGRIAFIPFIPRPETMIQDLEKKRGKTLRRPKPSHRIGKKIGKWVTEKPWIIIAKAANPPRMITVVAIMIQGFSVTIIATTVIILGGLAAFVPKMQFTYGLLESFPEDMPSREGFTIIENHYPPGEIA